MKKKYEPPSITSPEPDDRRRSNFTPAAVTGCSYGAYGATCANGTDPQGTPGSCNGGGSPLVQNCQTGTSAGVDCIDGSDAFASCSTGTAVPADCTNGKTPLGELCSNGKTASTCSNGTGPG